MSERLDILLYAHDGRGLGHVSRSVAIGMAIRRLAPRLRVLLITGSARAGDLIGPAPLDWLKLPAYASRIEQGQIRSIAGPSGFSDQDLAELRTTTIKAVIRRYRPRLVLCDHSPSGKHRELEPAQDDSPDTRWILGVRAVVGEVRQVFSSRARDRFCRRFAGLLWYGDPAVLGEEPLTTLASQFQVQPVVCGYVARLRELGHWLASVPAEPLAGTIALPWLGPDSEPLFARCVQALADIGPRPGPWHLFAGSFPAKLTRHTLPAHVRPFLIGPEYGRSLAASRCAVIFGGTNSLTDVLSLGLPSLVLLRNMRDREQQHHLDLLCRATGSLLHPLSEQDADQATLRDLLLNRLATPRARMGIDLNGAAAAARHLIAMLNA